MSKGDAKRKKAQRRALENLERGLKRGNAGLVLDALIELPEGELPKDVASRARALIGPCLQAAPAKGEASESVQALLGALSRDSTLLQKLGLQGTEQRWQLFWAAANAGNWKAAELLLQPLTGMIAERAPALARCLQAYIAGSGTLDPSLLPAGIALPMHDAERLGYEPARPRAKLGSSVLLKVGSSVLLDDPERAENELVELYAGEPWEAFATVCEQWLRSARDPKLCRLCALVADLSAHELLCRASRPQIRGYVAPVELVIRAARSAVPGPAAPHPARREADDEQARIERALLLCLRVLFRVLADSDSERPPTALLLELVRESLRRDTLRPALAPALTELAGRVDLDSLAQLLPELHTVAPSPLLWVRAALALDRREERRVDQQRAPRQSTWEWIERTLQQHLSQPEELARTVNGLNHKERHRLLGLLSAILPPELAGDLFEALWPLAGEGLRAELVGFARQALEETTEFFMCGACDMPHAEPLERFDRLSAAGQKLFLRLEPVLLACDERILAVTLSRCTGRAEQRAALERFISEKAAPIDHFVSVIFRARQLGLSHKSFRERMCARFRGRIAALARGFELSLAKLGPRSQAARDLAEELVRADPDGRQPLSPELRSVLALARRTAARALRAREKRAQLELPVSTS